MEGCDGGSWSLQEFEGCGLWDRRCIRSLSKIGEKLADNMGSSFSAACGESLRQSAGMIFSRGKVTVDALQQGHYEQTAQRGGQYDRVIVAQDTSFANYTSHGATDGLGFIDSRGKSRGLVIHSAFAVTEQGLPLGVVGQRVWARDPKQRGRRRGRKSRSITEKESHKWLEALEWVSDRLAPYVREICVVADRESDVFEYMAYPRAENVELLLRATHPRKVMVVGRTEPVSLKEALNDLEVVGHKQVRIERSKKTVDLLLELSVATVEVYAPRHYPKSQANRKARMSLIRAREIDTDASQPVEWILLYSGECPDFESASRCVDEYTQRWKIERLHYTLKTGLGIEELQFDTAKKLSNAIAFCSVVAWRLMWLTYYARTNPDSSAQTVLSDQQKTVLEAAMSKPIKTVQEAVVAIGKLGGFLKSPKYKLPGVKTLWRGWFKLQLMAEGWRLSQGKDILQG